MKTGWKAAAAGLLLAGGARAAPQTVTLKVEGWHSKGDGFKAETAVKAVKGVQSATADSAKKVLVVVFDDALTTKGQVESAVEGAGYSVAR